MRTGNLSILISFLMIACIDSFNLHVDGVSKVLVADGMITNKPGPYSVKLFWSSNVGELLTTGIPVSGAMVKIIDDQGQTETLKDQGGGIYQTSNTGIQGTEGRSYHVEIITPDGQSYSSLPELLSPPGSIDSLYFEFEKSETIVNGQPLASDGFKIYVDAKGNELQSIMRWSWQGTYKVSTHPELEQAQPPGSKCCPPKLAPAPCSGYVCADTVTCTTVRQVAGCTCCTCYITENQDVPFLSDNLFAGNTFQKYQIAFVPFEPRNFLEKYYLHIWQFTITNTSYQFWKLVQSQIKSSSNLFQPPIAKIKGNMVSASGSAALGIFSACGMAEKTIWINRNDVPYTFEDPVILESCQVLNPTSTTQIPSFWN